MAPDYGAFPYDSDLTFNFELKVRVSSSGGAPSNYYAQSGVTFTFKSNETILGTAQYLPATTGFPFTLDDSSRVALEISGGEFEEHSISAGELLSRTAINPTDVDSVAIGFETYSSTRLLPYVEAELWVDNIEITAPDRD